MAVLGINSVCEKYSFLVKIHNLIVNSGVVTKILENQNEKK